MRSRIATVVTPMDTRLARSSNTGTRSRLHDDDDDDEDDAGEEEGARRKEGASSSLLLPLLLDDRTSSSWSAMGLWYHADAIDAAKVAPTAYFARVTDLRIMGRSDMYSNRGCDASGELLIKTHNESRRSKPNGVKVHPAGAGRCF
jgi:hypothetical protein